MIRVGGTYRFGNEIYEPFVFVVVDAIDDYQQGDRTDLPGFRCLMLRGVFKSPTIDAVVEPGGVFHVAERSGIACESTFYDGSDP